METLAKKLESLALRKSIPFCYSCYVEAPSGCCARCHSDDLMRLVPGIGLDYGIRWVVDHLVKTNMSTAHVDEVFEESVRQCYPEIVEVGWLKLDTVDTIKNSDPLSWDLAQSEWIDAQIEDGQLVTFDNGGTYYWVSDLEDFVNQSSELIQESS